jgi:chitin disaccharide deacetylase
VTVAPDAAWRSDAAAPRRRIWLVADDYGMSPAVNAAIRDLAAHGRLSATSVMVVAPSFTPAETRALATPEGAPGRIAIGLHVTLTAPFRPLTPGFTPTHAGAFLPLGTMMRRALLGRLDRAAIAAEIAAQLGAFHDAFGRAPDYVDGHQHVQLLPTVRDALLAVVQAQAPSAWVRQCGAVAPRLADPKGLLLDRLSRGFRARAAARGIRTNPAFAGTYDFSDKLPFAERFVRFLRGLPDGGLVMCHPGHVDDELRRLDPVTDQRAREYAYLAGDDFEALLRAQGVTLAGPARPRAASAG